MAKKTCRNDVSFLIFFLLWRLSVNDVLVLYYSWRMDVINGLFSFEEENNAILAGWNHHTAGQEVRTWNWGEVKSTNNSKRHPVYRRIKASSLGRPKSIWGMSSALEDSLTAHFETHSTSTRATSFLGRNFVGQYFYLVVIKLTKHTTNSWEKEHSHYSADNSKKSYGFLSRHCKSNTANFVASSVGSLFICSFALHWLEQWFSSDDQSPVQSRLFQT